MEPLRALSPRIARSFAVACLLMLAGCGTADNIRTAPPAAGSAGRTLTVLSFNIRLGLGQGEPKGDIYRMPWGRGLGAVIAAIRAVDPDIAGLQEVAGIDQIRRIATALDMNYAFAWHGAGSSRAPWWGVGILSRFPIKAHRAVEISTGRGNTRSVAIATLDVGGRDLTAVSIHKDRDLKDGKAMANILAAVAGEEAPVVLIGDFNVTPDDWRLDGIKRWFVDTAAVAGTPSAAEVLGRGTFYRSRRRIDYVFAEKGRFAVIDAGLAPVAVRRASDHVGYWARLLPADR